jgi:hypothetical protein
MVYFCQKYFSSEMLKLKMKRKNILTLVKNSNPLIYLFGCFTISTFTFSQNDYDLTSSSLNGDNLNSEFIQPKSMGFWVIPSNGAASPWVRIPGNTHRFQRNRFIVTANEIENSGFLPNLTIDAIGFHIASEGIGTQTGNLKIYMKNTTDTINELGNTWDISNFTLVCDIASWTVPIDAGAYEIPFTGGIPFTYTGDGVYVAFEFSNPSGSIGSEALSATCNNSLNNGVFSSQNNSSFPTTLAASAFRPQTQFINTGLVDIARVDKIYTLEKVAAGFAPAPLKVLVSNVSSSIIDFDLIITIQDTNFSTVYHSATEAVIGLDAGESRFVEFPGWNPSTIDEVIVTAETSAIQGENWLSNNSVSQAVSVNSNTLSFNYDNSNASAFGYNHPNSGLFLAKYKMEGVGSVKGANIVIPEHSANPGNTIYAVLMNSSGNIVAQSDAFTIQNADMGTTKSFLFPNPIPLENSDFYVGVAQTAGTSTWRPLGVFSENPRRDNTFFSAALNGSGLAELETPFKLKFGIEAILEEMLSIDELENIAFSIFPNPFNSAFHVTVQSHDSKHLNWKLIDMHGRTVLSAKQLLNKGETKWSINTERLSPGIYMFLTEVNDSAAAFKIIKN